jgi:hypothetical protein
MTPRPCTACERRAAVVLESERGEHWLCGPCWMSYLLTGRPPRRPTPTAAGRTRPTEPEDAWIAEPFSGTLWLDQPLPFGTAASPGDAA